MTTPRTHYLIELSKLIGRLGYALDSGDTQAYLGILTQIKTLTEQSIIANTPRLPFVIRDDPFYRDEDDDL